jgi:hypothetical protein
MLFNAVTGELQSFERGVKTELSRRGGGLSQLFGSCLGGAFHSDTAPVVWNFSVNTKTEPAPENSRVVAGPWAGQIVEVPQEKDGAKQDPVRKTSF